jgi:transcription-repair coupling factor (superfamily II helicase)
MDRLVCGDVGFGKTEVAIRAAFAVAVNGRQTLMLAPTTNPRRAALAHLPLALPRLPRAGRDGLALPAAEGGQAGARDFQEGKVDVLIGTHPNPQPRRHPQGARARHPRRGAALRRRAEGAAALAALEVDVLTLSATPIPRTLHMSLSGLRDISIIETPPEGRRPIRTTVGEYDEELVKLALEREVEREGSPSTCTTASSRSTRRPRSCSSSPEPPLPRRARTDARA